VPAAVTAGLEDDSLNCHVERGFSLDADLPVVLSDSAHVDRSSNVARPTSVDWDKELGVPHARPTEIAATSAAPVSTAAPARTPFASRPFDITVTILREKMAFMTAPPVAHRRHAGALEPVSEYVSDGAPTSP
jgi:hypothetical protein